MDVGRVARAAAALLLGVASIAAADERRGEVYLSAGVALFHEPGLTGTGFVTYETAPGGTTAGWMAGGGVFLARWVSVEAELSRTGAMHAREPSRYDMVFDDERHDLFVLGALRFHVPVGAVADFEPVVGGGIVSTTDTSTVEYEPIGGGTTGAARPAVTTTATVAARGAVGLGADLRLGNGRVQFVPSFRVMFTAGYPSWPTYYPGGAPDRAIRTGASVRLRF